MSGLLLAMVGTDHHPFDRFVDWADDVAVRHPEVHVLVQHGASKAPVVAEGRPYLTHDELVSLLETACAVMCHGGPGTIMDARDAGHVPVCVPRDPRRGEHVDGHQLRFAALVARAGVVTDAEDHPTFHTAIDDALLVDAAAVPGGHRSVLRSPQTDAARLTLAAELDQLVLARPPRLIHRRRGAL